MSVFISEKDTAKLYVQFFRPIYPKSKQQCKNELIYIRDFEAVHKNSHSCIIRFNTESGRVFSGFGKTQNILTGNGIDSNPEATFTNIQAQDAGFFYLSLSVLAIQYRHKKRCTNCQDHEEMKPLLKQKLKDRLQSTRQSARNKLLASTLQENCVDTEGLFIFLAIERKKLICSSQSKN